MPAQRPDSGGHPTPLPGARLYAKIPDRPSGGFDGQLIAFAEELRFEHVAIGTAELLDAFNALTHVSWHSQPAFKEALAATLAKSPEDRRVFELVFDRFFFRAAEAEAARQQITESPASGTADALDIDLEELRRQIASALRDGLAAPDARRPAGQALAASYTWDRAAAAHLAFYEGE